MLPADRPPRRVNQSHSAWGLLGTTLMVRLFGHWLLIFSCCRQGDGFFGLRLLVDTTLRWIYFLLPVLSTLHIPGPRRWLLAAALAPTISTCFRSTAPAPGTS